MTPFLVLLTNVVTLIQLPSGLCYDHGIFGASFDTGDTNPAYGLKLDVFDARSNVIAGAWIMEARCVVDDGWPLPPRPR